MNKNIQALNLVSSSPHFHTIDKIHGRLEIRKIWVSDSFNNTTSFPHIKQVFVIERTVTHIKSKRTSTENVCGITSLTKKQASPGKILKYNREHWGIENRVHWVRDVTFDEDRSQIRTKNGPRMMAGLRNFAISLLRLFGFENIAGALRQFAGRPHKSLALIGF